MPKRRLGYSQVGGTTSPKDSGHKRTVEEIPKQAGDSGSSNNDGREALTHSRNMDILLKLSESCRQHADFHKPRAEPINVYDAPDQWPSTCRHDLDTLRNLLPRVEKTFDPSRTCPAQEVASLCDFYATVLRGDHCPYAPHLLDLGRNPKTVLIRVFFLFRHLVTPDVVSSAQSESLSDLTNTVETCLRTIADTIAHFLSFIAETRLALLIVTDLVNMLEDCALLCQVFQNKGSGSIQLSLLEKTRRAAGSDEPMALDLPHLDKVWTLQTAGYLILRDYLRYQHTKRSQEVPLQSGYADVHVSPELCPSSVMTPLLASLRYTMLQSPHDTLTRNRTLAALAVFLQILLDRRYLPDDASQLFETSVLACHLVQFQFMDSKKLAFDLQYQRRLDLVQDIFCLAVVELPVDSRLPSRFLARSILPFMLDCIGSMSHQDQHPLSLVVLEAVLRFLQDPKVIAPQYLLDMTSYCLGHGVLVHLVKLMSHTELYWCGMEILTVFLPNVCSPADLDSICRLVLQSSTNNSVASVTGDLPKSSGTKRKRDKPQSPIKPLALASPSAPRFGVGNTLADEETSFSSFLRRWLEESLFAAERLARIVLNATPNRPFQPNQRLVDDAWKLSTGSCLLLQAHYFYSPGSLDKCVSLRHLLDQNYAVLGGLVKALPTSHSCQYSLAMTSRLLDCVLFLHFKNPLEGVPIFPTFETPKYSEIMGNRMFFQKHPGGDMQSRRIAKCPLIQRFVSETCSFDDCEVHGCVCSLLTEKGSRRLVSTQFRDSVCLSVYRTFSVGTKCCLLSALYEPENKASLFLDSILDLWSSTKNQSFFPVAVACTFVPTWLRRRLHNSDSFRTLLSSLLSDVLLPIAQDCSQLSGQVCKGLLQATVEVQHCMMELNNTSLHPPSSLCSLDSFGILKQLLLISPRASFPGDLQKPSPQDQESISTVHRIVGILFEGIPKDHGSVDVRKLRWVCMVHDVIPFMSGGDSGLLQGPSKDGADKPVWLWLVEASMLDPSEEMRTFVAQQIVPIILTEDGSFLLSQIASREEVRETKALSYNQPSEKTVDSVTTKFFHFFDKLLHSTVGVSTSQLTFSVATSSGTQTSWKDKELRLQVQRVACRLLASFCLQSNFDLPFPKSVFERSFQRLVRLWASSTHEEGMDVLFPVSPYYSTRKALAFGGCSGVYMQKLDCLQALQQVSPGYIATVMGDIFVLGCNVNKEVLFLSLECFLRAMFQKEATRFIQGIHSVKAVSSFLECELPYTVAQLVTEKDIALLHLVTGFRQFLVERAKHLRGKVSCQVVGASNLVARWAYPSTGLSSNDLKSKTKSMCLEPVLLEKLLPVLFISSDKEGLSFFTREVVPGKTLHELTKQKEQLALKGLAWELGRDQTSFGPAKLGIRAAAVAVAVNMRRGNQEQASVSGISLGKNWVTSHFMYLLVTVVQYRWNARTLKERLHAVRSLYNLLDFLLPEEAAQYVPQVMATVNAAILDGNPSKWGFETEKAQSGNLRLLAVECLSTFVKLVAETQYETIAQNLTAIVVSLIPVIVEEGTSTRSKSFISTARDAAVGLLEFLVQGDLGRRLAPHLTRVPFLPAVPALEGVHRALRQIGVDFDNLYALSFSTQRAGDMAKQYSNADTLESASSASMGIPSFSRLAALQKRLSLVLGLLDNENVSVRGIALQHVTDLLQGNRNLYHHLVRSEELSNGKHFLTVVFTDQGGNSKWTSSGVVTRMIQKLLGRCVVESDSGCRLRLAVCLGEVGAIAEGRLGDLQVGSSMGHETIDSPNSSYNWRLNQPPWQSQVVKYQLQLVTNNLVAALKAAASTTEQHKISFSVQQLLRQLNKVGEQENSSPNNRKMTKWLEETLQEKGVLDLVEPFFQSDFKEKSRDVQDDKQPPFYRLSLSLNSWLAKFCHWMIQRSHRTEMSPWSELFFACRTAVRTEAGIDIAEFILPLLVLDRICFGTLHEIGLLRNEFVDVLKMDSPDLMDPADRHRATNVLFRTLDTLRVWSDREIEGQFKRRASTATSRGRREASTIPTDSGQVQSWPVDEAVDKIGEFLKDLPSILQAQAAAKIGMNARALRNLELHIREKRVVHLFEKSVNEQKRDELETDLQNLAGVSIPWEVSDLMVNMLHRLDDFETMMAIGRSSSLFNQARYIQDNIKAKEAVSDFESAIQEYERALQIPHDKLSRKLLETGSLRCLLELGRYESVLNQVRGLIHHSTEDTDLENLNSIAVEAAWKLGRWDTLSDLLESVGQSSPGKLSGVGDDYETQFGRAMLGLHNKDHGLVEDSIRRARESVLHSLSSAAAESYTRSYADITRLQCLRELENTDAYFHDDTRSKHSSFRDMTQTSGLDTWCWDGRAELVSSFAVSSVSTTRVALSRVHDEKVLAGSIFLNSGKRARKNKQTTTAENLLFQSQAILDMVVPQDRCPEFYILVHSTQEQLAKLKHDNGDNAVALQMLRYDILDTAVNEMLEHGGSPSKHADLAARFEMRVSDRKVELNSKQLVSRFARRLLQVTTWEAGVGLKGCSDIMSRFRLVLELAPTWEKGHFQFGKYVDTLLQSRMTGLGNKLVASKELQLGIDEDEMRSEVLWRDKVCQKYAILAMQQYAASLKIDVKHVYQALPRVLSLWFDLVSVNTSKYSDGAEGQLESLHRIQNQANAFMAGQVKDIPAIAFYTTMPQLISRVTHDNIETSLVVKSILQRVLIKFPQQALWTLAWLKGSVKPERSAVGEEIFKDAQKMLAKNHKSMSDLLAAAQSLFRFLRELAVYQGSSERRHSNVLQVRPWQSTEVELSDFVPPIQAALSVSSLSGSSQSTRDHFPRAVPRMRAFSSRVGVMASKAKPKKLKAYAVPGTYRAPKGQQSDSGAKARGRHDDVDIGELHFLVKQEAKGDLRKDARVQDLNNMINRLMTIPDDSDAASRMRRRLNLRTFAVTCLSEDICILEWVPNTDSLRNLVSKSYNPQTSAHCTRRRGNRIANFGDATLRSHYEMSQNKYFKDGNLSKAAAMFEDHCLRQYPPLLYWWFVQTFHDPHAWYEARTRFTLSAAAWSAVGHVIGLGDRHSENILVDTTNGECVHVDFDCIFDKGLHLPRPEVVPFRLTANMIDAFGPTGAEGLYEAGLRMAMHVLRDNRDTLLSVLEPFLKDPVIDWKRQKSRTQQAAAGTASTAQERQSQEAKRSIKVIDERLQGYYNLRNPNLRKYRRTDQTEQHDEMSHLVPLSVEGQVRRMIQEATSNENLVQLYVGWMPWL